MIAISVIGGIIWFIINFVHERREVKNIEEMVSGPDAGNLVIKQDTKNILAKMDTLKDQVGNCVNAEISDVKREVSSVKEQMIAEFAVNAERRAALREREKDISETICKLSEFDKIMLELRSENENLKQESRLLREEKSQLIKVLSKYQQREAFQDQLPDK